jgi:hypothetical protein
LSGDGPTRLTRRGETLLLAVILVAAVLLVYVPVLKAGFIWDDDLHLTKNPCVVGPLGF